MKALQSLNPQSTEFLSFEKMCGLIHAYNANTEDLKYELYCKTYVRKTVQGPK